MDGAGSVDPEKKKKKKGASSDIDGTDKVDDRLLHWCSSVQAA